MGPRSTCLLFVLAVAHPLAAQPRIFENGAVNAAGFLSPAAPGGALAQGSIFSIFGEDLASNPIQSRDFPLPTALGGAQTLVVTSDGRSVPAPLLYVSPSQINAVLPSSVPVGRHLLRVQRDGLPSNDLNIKVVAAAYGQFFSDDHGVPLAVAQAATPSSSWRISLEAPAKPGSIVTLWGTGLGPTSAGDDQPPPASASTAEIEVRLAGRPLAHSYAGRSPCCAGLDQINVEIPQDSPVGCVVPLAVLVNGNVSNHSSLPISADGSSCDPRLSFRTGRLSLVRQWTGSVFQDRTSGLFDRPLDRLDPIRFPPVGACMVWRNASASSRWFDVASVLNPRSMSDAGEAIALTTPSGPLELKPSPYMLTSPPAQAFLGAGPYTASAPGGESFPPFGARLTASPAPVLEVLDPKDVWARSSPTLARWFGGDSEATGIFWSGPPGDPDVVCRAPIGARQFQVPSYVWANQLPGQRLFAFGSAQSSELTLATDGPDYGLLVYREELVQSGDLGPPHLSSTPVRLPSGEIIQAEMAATAAERNRGLMQRPSLDRDKGMLFLFESAGLYRFWMLNTIIPLDIIWLDSDRRVLFISANTPPCQAQACPTYGPDTPSRYVLELGAGEAARRGLRLGDRLAW